MDIAYVNRDGTLTFEGKKLFDRIGDLSAKMDAIAAVIAPTGGATQDAEARAAIADIIAGAT